MSFMADLKMKFEGQSQSVPGCRMSRTDGGRFGVAVQTEQPKRQRPPESKHLMVAVMTKHDAKRHVFCRPPTHVETCITFVFTATIILDTNKAMRATIAS